MISVVQRDGDLQVHTAGVAQLGRPGPPRATDAMHIASTAKAFSGGVALSLVDRRMLGLDDTIGFRRPDLPRAWYAVTLRQLLNHTGGVPDFVANPAARGGDRQVPGQGAAAAPVARLRGRRAPRVHPGEQVRVLELGQHHRRADGRSRHPPALRARARPLVSRPLGLRATSLPAGPELPRPFLHGYVLDRDGGAPEDVSEVLAGGWSWASGGIVSTPLDMNRFIRGYVGGELFGRQVAAEQARFIPGGSEPTGPGRNTAGLALFRYDTRCGTVLGHTGNTLGYTQFFAASRDGRRSVTMSINVQRTQKSTGQEGQVFAALRAAEEDAVCAALARP